MESEWALTNWTNLRPICLKCLGLLFSRFWAPWSSGPSFLRVKPHNGLLYPYHVALSYGDISLPYLRFEGDNCLHDMGHMAYLSKLSARYPCFLPTCPADQSSPRSCPEKIDPSDIIMSWWFFELSLAPISHGNHPRVSSPCKLIGLFQARAFGCFFSPSALSSIFLPWLALMSFWSFFSLWTSLEFPSIF